MAIAGDFGEANFEGVSEGIGGTIGVNGGGIGFDKQLNQSVFRWALTDDEATTFGSEIGGESGEATAKEFLARGARPVVWGGPGGEDVDEDDFVVMGEGGGEGGIIGEAKISAEPVDGGGHTKDGYAWGERVVAGGLVEAGATGHGAGEGEFVGVFEATAGGHALGEAGEGDGEVSEEGDEIIGGGFAFDIGAEGEDDFGGGIFGGALEEGIDAEIVGADVIEGGDAATEGVVATGESARAFDGEDIGGLFDDAEEEGVAKGIGAELAMGFGGEEATEGAGVNALGDALDGASDFGGVGVWGLDHPEGDAFGASGADAWQAFEFGDELADGWRIFCAFHWAKDSAEGVEREGGGRAGMPWRSWAIRRR